MFKMFIMLQSKRSILRILIDILRVQNDEKNDCYYRRNTRVTSK